MTWFVHGDHKLKIDLKLGINLKVPLLEFTDRNAGLSKEDGMCKSLIAFNNGKLG